MTGTDIALAASALIALFFISSMLAPSRWRLAGALWSASFQIFTIPVAGIYPPATLLAGLALWPEMVEAREILRWLPVKLYLALFAMHALSIAWSANPMDGVRHLVYMLPFLLILSASYRLARRGGVGEVKLVSVFACTAVVEGALVILFRVLPGLKLAFLHSSVAGLFITPNGLQELFDGGYSILDPVKSGGFFANANAAAGFLSSSAFGIWGIASAARSRNLSWAARFLWCSVFFTGSKGGAALNVAMLILAWFAPLIIGGSRFIQRSRIIACAAMLSAIAVGSTINSEFARDSQTTLNSRQQVWAHALQQFHLHPLMGQGFGGWAQSYRYYAASFGNTMIIPPHNTLVYAWSLSGIVAVLLILAFMFSVIGFGMKAQRSPSAEVRAMATGMTLSFLVVFIQGMGENHGVVGDMHMQPPLAVLLGLTYAHYRRARSALPEAT